MAYGRPRTRATSPLRIGVAVAAARPDVLVVGAGPAGLVAALELARHGVRTRIIDGKAGPTAQSRAALVHARSLEVLDRLGVAEAALHRGVPLSRVEVRDHGGAGATFRLADRGVEGRTRFPCVLSLEQSETEKLLVAALAGHGVQVEWGTRLRHVLRTRPFVEVVVTHGGDGSGDTETVAATWLLAADGAGSTVRRALGIGFPGTTYAQAGLLADVHLDADLPADRLRLSLGRGGFAGIQPLRDGRHRLFGAVTEGFVRPAEGARISQEAYSDLAHGELRRWFDESSQVDARIVGVEWAALFRVHSRRADTFRRGNVFLVGDAAHIHSPAGGQGMNLGIGDAANLAWKIAAGRRRPAVTGTRLLDTYETERGQVADAVIRNTDRGFRFECSANPVAIWARKHVAVRMMSVLVHIAVVRRGAFRLLSQTWISYRRNPALPAGADGRRLRAGDRAPDARLAGGSHLLTVLREPGFRLFVFEGRRRAQADFDRLCGLGRQAGAVPVQVLRRADVEAHHAYGVTRPCAVLIRPDGHVAGWCRSARDGEVGRFARFLDRTVAGEAR
jgi:2-polyprenyl-6-methoxyphenol hydroxylase-like FAD-dependent oxidoreductase